MFLLKIRIQHFLLQRWTLCNQHAYYVDFCTIYPSALFNSMFPLSCNYAGLNQTLCRRLTRSRSNKLSMSKMLCCLALNMLAQRQPWLLSELYLTLTPLMRLCFLWGPCWSWLCILRWNGKLSLTQGAILSWQSCSAWSADALPIVSTRERWSASLCRCTPRRHRGGAGIGGWAGGGDRLWVGSGWDSNLA